MPVWLTRSCELDVEGNLILDGGTEQAARYSKGRKDRIAKRRNADGSGDKFCRGGNFRSMNARIIAKEEKKKKSSARLP